MGSQLVERSLRFGVDSGPKARHDAQTYSLRGYMLRELFAGRRHPDGATRGRNFPKSLPVTRPQ